MSPPLSNDWLPPRLGSPVPGDTDYCAPSQPSSPELEAAVLIDADDNKEDRFSDRPPSNYDWSASELEGFRCGKSGTGINNSFDNKDGGYNSDSSNVEWLISSGFALDSTPIMT
ncbi:hypothetical protein E2562_014130 [Oryza meyeriana var. granulata]|uniref:Uncharacterized protein n=1 Tax=Oryza meyeriana var. granulata TaxID=110450 RepID=A0A6G1F8B8_9ORYZ|nr:hypothetical protein E2562_014130 [Oryza meyeriana var. granulata]